MDQRPSTSDGRGPRQPRVPRSQAAADAIASVRAEGLDPGRAEGLLAAWERGEVTDEQLEQLSLRLLHEPEITVDELLAGTRAA